MKHGPSTLISVIAIALSSLAVAPAATAQSTCGAQTTANAGETLADVAERCGVTVEALMEANPALSAQEVAPGVEIDMPGTSGNDLLGRARDAVRGAAEEIEGAAESVGRSVTDYLSDNPDLSRDILEFGERVGLPGVSAGPSAGAEVVVSPSAAGIGDEVTVHASGLRGDAKVAISAVRRMATTRCSPRRLPTRQGGWKRPLSFPNGRVASPSWFSLSSPRASACFRSRSRSPETRNLNAADRCCGAA